MPLSPASETHRNIRRLLLTTAPLPECYRIARAESAGDMKVDDSRLQVFPAGESRRKRPLLKEGSSVCKPRGVGLWPALHTSAICGRPILAAAAFQAARLSAQLRTGPEPDKCGLQPVMRRRPVGSALRPRTLRQNLRIPLCPAAQSKTAHRPYRSRPNDPGNRST